MPTAVRSELVGNVIQVPAKIGDSVEFMSVIAVIESMKMEIPILADVVGTVRRIDVAVGDLVGAGAVVAMIESAWPSRGASPATVSTGIRQPASLSQPEEQ
jgi:acetyl-CoA carboxylase biotin carboxyl carrier protein